MTLPPLNIDLIVKNIGKLPSPSAVIVDLLRVIDDEEISSTALARIITRDQAIVVRMLRIANSSFYGMAGKVGSVADAIAVLGLRTVRTLAAGAAISGSLGSTLAPGFELKRFWRHSIATAVGARLLARRLNQGEGAAFVAGLIHDIGHLMLACSFPEYAAAVLQYQQEHDDCLSAAERAVLGMDHACIGGILAERWHFPPAICQAIRHHHDPSQIPDAPLARTVYLASILAQTLEQPGSPEERLRSVPEAIWSQADLSAADGEALLDAIESEFVPLCDILAG
ncbi:MAG: HDOD domain-containing protein [Bacteroidota bacterium]